MYCLIIALIPSYLPEGMGGERLSGLKIRDYEMFDGEVVRHAWITVSLYNLHGWRHGLKALSMPDTWLVLNKYMNEEIPQ